jgi:hypothetical protein
LVKIIDVVRNRQRTHDFFMTMIRISGSQLRACLWSSRAKRWPSVPASAATASASDGRRHPGSALPQLLSTLIDEFAFRRISRIDVCVLPIQIEHHWQDIAAGTPPLPCADYPL